MPRGDARHLARERALELLYEAELKQVPPSSLLATLPVAPSDRTCALVQDAERVRELADRRIAEAAGEAWPLERLAVLDRLVMVLAIAEATGEDPPPDAVVLDEAVQLATTYSTESSGRFVNGVLAAIFATLERHPGRSGHDPGRGN